MSPQFISYPKSGRSWVRFILTELNVVEEVRFQHDCFEFNDGNKPPHDFRVISRLKRYSIDTKIVYLTRDPRDLMVSLYFQITGRFKDFFNYQGNISEFIRDDYFGANSLRIFQNIWEEMSEHRDVLALSYEDIHKDTVGSIEIILNHYGFQYDYDEIVGAVKKASFSNMKRIEQSSKFPYPWLRPRNGYPKVRKGKVGGYNDILCDDDIKYINDLFNIR